MNAKIIGALNGIRDNLTVLIEELEAVSRVTTIAEQNAEAKAETTESTAPAATPVTKAKLTTSRKEREASETIPDVSGGLTEEQLNGLSYNSLKKLAKDIGIPATGARDELTQKILNAKVSALAPEAEEEEPVKDEKKSSAKKTPAKVSKKPEPVEEEDDEEEEDPIVAKVNEAVADMTNEEIADVLADAGVRAKGKREALIAAVIKAVRDGKIDLDDEEESEEEETEDESTDEEGEYDVNDFNNPDMTEERKAAIEAFDAETRASFDGGDITRKELVAWLNEFHGTKDTMKKKSDEDILSEYIYCSCLLINDEGEFPEEEGAYTVNGIPYCCGHELAYNEDNNTYICETCGNEYEAEAED